MRPLGAGMAPAARKAGLDRRIHCANRPRDQPAEAVPEIKGLFSVALSEASLPGITDKRVDGFMKGLQ